MRKRLANWAGWGGLLALLTGIALVDNVISRQQLPALKEENFQGPLSEYVMQVTRLSRARGRLLPVIEDEEAEPTDRIAALSEYESILLDEGDVQEALRLNHYLVGQLRDRVELGAIALKLFKHFSGKSPLGGSKQAKEAAPEVNLPGMVWIFRQRMENIKATSQGDRYAKDMASMVDLAVQSGLQAQALEALSAWLDAEQDSRGILKLLAAADASQAKMPHSQRAEFLQKLVGVSGRLLKTFPEAAVCDRLIAVAAGWYHYAVQEANPHLKVEIIELINQAQDACQEHSLAALRTLVEVYATSEQASERRRMLEAAVLPRLEEAVRGPEAQLADFDCLRLIYRWRDAKAELAWLERREAALKISQKRLAGLNSQLNPIMADLKAGRVNQATGRFAALKATWPEEIAAENIVKVSEWVLSLAAVSQGTFKAGADLPAADAAEFIVSVPSDLQALLGEWCIKAFVAVRNGNQSELARRIANLGLKALKASPSFREWLAAEVWMLDGGNGDGPRPICQVPFVSPADIVVDGKLGEAAYQKAGQINQFGLVGESQVVDDPLRGQLATSVRLVHDGTWLYLAVQAAETDMAACKVSMTQRDSDIWREDCIEFFVGADRSLTNYQQWVFNRLGAFVDLNHGDLAFVHNKQAITRLSGKVDKSFDSATEVAGMPGAGGWTVEARIPLGDIPGLNSPCHGAVVTANIRRFRYGRQSRLEVRTWDRRAAHDHSPESFNYLRFQ